MKEAQKKNPFPNITLAREVASHRLLDLYPDRARSIEAEAFDEKGRLILLAIGPRGGIQRRRLVKSIAT